MNIDSHAHEKQAITIKRSRVWNATTVIHAVYSVLNGAKGNVDLQTKKYLRAGHTKQVDTQVDTIPSAFQSW